MIETAGFDEPSAGPVLVVDDDPAIRELLQDLMIPIMSGAEATSRLKSDPGTAAIPVLAMSAGRNLTAVALDVPADDFIPKPFDLTELIATIAHHAMSRANRI